MLIFDRKLMRRLATLLFGLVLTLCGGLAVHAQVIGGLGNSDQGRRTPPAGEKAGTRDPSVPPPG